VELRDVVVEISERLGRSVCVDSRVHSGDALESVPTEHTQRHLNAKLVLRASPDRVKRVQVEGVFDGVAHFFDRKQHPADGGHRRDHTPPEGVHERERQREAEDREHAAGVAAVGLRHGGLDDALARAVPENIKGIKAGLATAHI